MLSCKRVTSLTLDAVKSLWGRLPRQAEARPGPAERSPRACPALTPPFFHLYSPSAFLQDSTRGRLRPPPKAPQAQGGAPAPGCRGGPAGGRWGPLPRKGCRCSAEGAALGGSLRPPFPGPPNSRSPQVSGRWGVCSCRPASRLRGRWRWRGSKGQLKTPSWPSQHLWIQPGPSQAPAPRARLCPPPPAGSQGSRSGPARWVSAQPLLRGEGGGPPGPSGSWALGRFLPQDGFLEAVGSALR